MMKVEKEKKENTELLHMTSKLDNRFSFNGEIESIEQDAIHKAVGSESWYQVSAERE
jgi:hypothetical protein